MSKYKLSIEHFLINTRLVITNVLKDDDAFFSMEEFGYDYDRIAQGKDLYDTAHQLYLKLENNYPEDIEAADVFQELWEKAFEEYLFFLRIVRIAIRKKDNILYNFYVPQKKSFSGWVEQAGNFYQYLLEDENILNQLINYKVTKDKLLTGQELLKQAKESWLKMTHQNDKQYQKILTERDQTIDQLAEWMHDFVGILKIALEKKPKLLEKIGVSPF
ncbi:MAG: hypothetical protein MJB14_08740 [Spirochaetes bacterium]|nr:hypothetical protein [Spirochaetota bacterium]